MNEIELALQALQAKLAAYIKPGTADAATRQKEVLDKIRNDFHTDVWQPIANVGFAAGKTSRDGEVMELTTKVTGLEGQLQAKESELVTFRDKHKDVAAVQNEAAQKIREAEEKVTIAKREAAGTVEKAFRDRDVRSFEAALVAKGLDKDWARAQGILLRERIKYDKGVLTVMQEGSENIPYTAHGEELIGILADETFKKAPAGVIINKVDNGGGSTGAGGSGGSAGSDFYKNIQKEEADRAAASKKTDVGQLYGRA